MSISQVAQNYDDPSAMVKELHRNNVTKKQRDIKKSELDRYLDDDFEELPDDDPFDILKWWGGKSVKYHVLSRMARDILVIPVSMVSSESAFSTGGRVLDSCRSSLRPSTIEDLICAQNWLKKQPKKINFSSHVVEVESELAVGISG
ncbi:PREDICTED: zinc finger BED domain-containing protein RICESLEEPER 2-like [Lupinus angustifolius]|uniref:zinc finger BED domain-containing protein RICESLEEPER 2-like n=1 Tax=Lupinus angustifolius TaxID=3871 RepID=UPI00092E6413|nr:PREDICTED: zinc finger BED domain-containing protein RICESLEEPER 2-like [Lupinus angustifolius]